MQESGVKNTMTKEEILKNEILSHYKSLREFTIKSNIPYSTVNAILKRGIDNSSISNVSKICHELQISVDELIYNSKIVPSGHSTIETEKTINILYVQQLVKFKLETTDSIKLDDIELTAQEKQFIIDSIEIIIDQIRKKRERRNKH